MNLKEAGVRLDVNELAGVCFVLNAIPREDCPVAEYATVWYFECDHVVASIADLTARGVLPKATTALLVPVADRIRQCVRERMVFHV